MNGVPASTGSAVQDQHLLVLNSHFKFVWVVHSKLHLAMLQMNLISVVRHTQPSYRAYIAYRAS